MNNVINMELAQKQQLLEEDIKKLLIIYEKINILINHMSKLNPIKNKKELIDLYNKWTNYQFTLQDLWKFPRDATFHRDYELPHCTCPKIDNYERLGTIYRVRTEGCIYHG